MVDEPRCHWQTLRGTVLSGIPRYGTETELENWKLIDYGSVCLTLRSKLFFLMTKSEKPEENHIPATSHYKLIWTQHYAYDKGSRKYTS